MLMSDSSAFVQKLVDLSTNSMSRLRALVRMQDAKQRCWRSKMRNSVQQDANLQQERLSLAMHRRLAILGIARTRLICSCS
jgi:hypothetical protein